ncbi:hypothetical protein RhiJN_28134 [Ceratobasidium sp. AG-Ba]|nr:hypothetical protein RhiJN_28134 [Ceratobasidium sp. AG-Ba]
MISRICVTLLFAFISLAAAAPTLVVRADLTAGPACGATVLNSHDCNVALLSLGGGIAGKIQTLRITAQAVDGGTSIAISKGRLEQGFKAFVAKCGVKTGTVTIAGGAPNGNIKLTMVAN